MLLTRVLKLSENSWSVFPEEGPVKLTQSNNERIRNFGHLPVHFMSEHRILYGLMGWLQRKLAVFCTYGGGFTNEVSRDSGYSNMLYRGG